MTLFIIFVLAFILWSYGVENNALIVKKQVIHTSEDYQGPEITMAIITDLHIGHTTSIKKLKELVDKVNSLNADIIINLGDYDAHKMKLYNVDKQDVIDAFSCLHAPMGVYSILGNHDGLSDSFIDFGFPDPLDAQKAMIVEIIEKSNMTLLDNTHTILEKDGKKVALIGTSDTSSTTKPYPLTFLDGKISEKDYPYLYETLENVPQGLPKILLNHSPDIFPFVPDDVALTLSGHTHGSQVAIPLIKYLILPSRYGLKYHKGLHKDQKKQLFVSSGVGTTVLPFRLGNPPEIVLLSIKSAQRPHKKSTIPDAAIIKDKPNQQPLPLTKAAHN